MENPRQKEMILPQGCVLIIFNILCLCLCEFIPKIEKQNSPNHVVYGLLGDNATMTCATDSTHNMTTTSWRLPDDNMITIGQDKNSSQSKYDMLLSDDSRNSTLTVRNISLEDNGRYSCLQQFVNNETMTPKTKQFSLRVVEMPQAPRQCQEVRLAIIHQVVKCYHDVTDLGHVVFKLIEITPGTGSKTLASSHKPMFDINKNVLERLNLAQTKAGDVRTVWLQVCCVSVYLEEARSCGQEIRVSIRHPSRINDDTEEDTTNRDIVIIGVSTAIVVFIIVIVIIIVIYYWRVKKRQAVLMGKRSIVVGDSFVNGRERSAHLNSTPATKQATKGNVNHLSTIIEDNLDLPSVPERNYNNNTHRNSITSEHWVRSSSYHQNKQTATSCDCNDQRYQHTEIGSDPLSSNQNYSFYKRFVPSNISARGKKKNPTGIKSQISDVHSTTNKNDFSMSGTDSGYHVRDFSGKELKSRRNTKTDADSKNNVMENDGYLVMSSLCNQTRDENCVPRRGKIPKNPHGIKNPSENHHHYVNLIAFDAEKVLCDKNMGKYEGFEPASNESVAINSKQQATPVLKETPKVIIHTNSNGSNTTLSRKPMQTFNDDLFYYKSTPDLRIFDDNDIVEILNAGSDMGGHTHGTSQVDSMMNDAFVCSSVQNGGADEREDNLTNTTLRRDASQNSIRRYFYNKRLTVVSPRLDFPPKLRSKSKVASHSDVCLASNDDVTTRFMTSLPNLSVNDGDVIYDVPRLREDKTIERDNEGTMI